MYYLTKIDDIYYVYDDSKPTYNFFQWIDGEMFNPIASSSIDKLADILNIDQIVNMLDHKQSKWKVEIVNIENI